MRYVLLLFLFCFSALTLSAENAGVSDKADSSGKKNTVELNRKKMPGSESQGRKRHNRLSLSNQTEFIAGLPEDERPYFQQLKEENPVKFHQAVAQYIQKQHRKNIERCKELREKYLKAIGTDQEAETKEELRQELSRQMHENLERTERYLTRSQKQLDIAQERLARFRQEYEKRKGNVQSAIERALKDWSDRDFVPPDFEFKSRFPADKKNHGSLLKSKEKAGGDADADAGK